MDSDWLSDIIVFKHRENKHKSKPTQFSSVASGVKKRLTENVSHRKFSRLSEFDKGRNLAPEITQKPKQILSELEVKQLQRKQKLDKWKEEKEKKKKEDASKKKKPFVTGVPRVPIHNVPPPINPRTIPSTSGRVTRSQTQNQKTTNKESNKSFAPDNAKFKPKLNIEIKPLVTVQNKKGKTNIGNSLRSIKTKAMSDKKNEVVLKAGTSKYLNGKVTKAISPKKTRQRKSIIIAQSNCEDSRSVNINSKVTSINSPKKTRQQRKSYVVAPSTSDESQSECSSGSKKAASTGGKKTTAAGRKSTSASMKSTSATMTSTSASVKSTSASMKSTSANLKSTSVKIKAKSDTNLIKTRQQRKSKIQSCMSDDSSSDNVNNAFNVKNTRSRNTTPKSESSFEERLRSPKDSIESSNGISEEKTISPCVILSRGKNNARKEMKKKIEEGLLNEDTGDVLTPLHFKRQLDSEITRMTLLCEKWDNISEEECLPEFVQELLLSAVGQARLLMSKKLQQFASLVRRCEERETGYGLVTALDLQGFWDMVFMQIENVDLRFMQLDELRKNKWAEKVPEVEETKKPAKLYKKVTKPRAAPSKQQGSRLKDMIAAARKAKKDQNLNTPKPAVEVEKTFEAGFFVVRSPIRSPAVTTPLKSLRKSVLTSEAKRVSSSASKTTTSYAVLKASQISRYVDIEGIAPLEQTPVRAPSIDLNATPARSILKSTNKNTAKKSSKKSIKVVLFNDSDSELNKSQTNENSDTISVISVNDIDTNTPNKENKSASRRRATLTRQEKIDEDSPIMTRSRGRSSIMKVDSEEKPKRSTRKKIVLQELDNNRSGGKSASKGRRRAQDV